MLLSDMMVGAPSKSVDSMFARSANLRNAKFFDTRWFGDHGIGRFAREVYSRLSGYTPVGFRGNPWSPSDVLTMSWRLQIRRPAFFYTPGYNAPIACPCAFALTIHDLNHISAVGQSSPLKRLYYSTVLRPAVRRAAAVLTVSEYSKAAIAEWSGIKADFITNVSNGVSPVFRPGVCVHDSGRPYLLGICSPKRHKNLDGLLRGYAFSRARKEHELRLVGNPDERNRQLLKSLGIDKSVICLGHLHDEDMATAYRGATGFVFVSHYEGFGLPIVEAMACGTPVITSSATSMPEVAGGAAVLANPADSEDIARAIDHLCDTPELRRQLSVLGLARAAHFSWEKTASNVRNALSPFDLLSNSAH